MCNEAKKAMQGRIIAREVAMKLVYSKLLGGSDTPDAVLEKSEITTPLEGEDLIYAENVTYGVESKLDEIDGVIAELSSDWTIDRIARVDLSILRVAIYEMKYRDDVPIGSSIDEAVELAKRFGGEKSYAFVNGILGTYADRLQTASNVTE